MFLSPVINQTQLHLLCSLLGEDLLTLNPKANKIESLSWDSLSSKIMNKPDPSEILWNHFTIEKNIMTFSSIKYPIPALISITTNSKGSIDIVDFSLIFTSLEQMTDWVANNS